MILAIIALAIGGSFIQRVTGFGFGILCMSMLPFLMPSYGEATALTGLLALVTVSFTAFQMRRHVCWKNLLGTLAVFLVVSFFSVRMVGSISSTTLRKILGVMLILASIYFMVFSGKIRIKPSFPAQASMGTLSGLMGGLFSMQGPPAVIYFLSSTDNKDEYMATISWYFFLGNIAMTLERGGNGFITPTVLKCWLFAAPSVLIGQWLGIKAFHGVPMASLRKIVYAYIGVAGILAIIF